MDEDTRLKRAARKGPEFDSLAFRFYIANMKDTTHVGNVTLAHVAAALLRRGRKVYLPFGDGGHFDLLVEDAGTVGGLARIQVKTGRLLKNGSINFKCHTILRGGGHRKYGNTVDAYGVYCPQNGKCYFVPWFVGKNAVQLRLVPPKNKQNARILWARDFEI